MSVEEPSPVVLTVACDGPECQVTGTSTNTGDPIPEGWLKVWGPSERLGRFDFHNGACYDNWVAEINQQREQLRSTNDSSEQTTIDQFSERPAARLTEQSKPGRIKSEPKPNQRVSGGND